MMNCYYLLCPPHTWGYKALGIRSFLCPALTSPHCHCPPCTCFNLKPANAALTSTPVFCLTSPPLPSIARTGEPVLLSSGGDNSLKQWIFDGPDGGARLLKLRSGPAAPPTTVLHYGEGGRRLLSGGQDRAFRLFSTVQDQQSRELSQHHTAKRAKRLKMDEAELKLARIAALDACEVCPRGAGVGGARALWACVRAAYAVWVS
jgi:hypothetical protein